MIAGIFIVSCVLLVVAYRFYGGFLARQFNIDETRPTPACRMSDGVDYVPTRGAILFGHHFSSIAGAGPIVGPIIAASYFGWGPTLAWILIGSIFIGGVHDFGSLVISVRHRARSVAEICRLYLSPLTYRVFLVFIWLALVYVLIVFIDLTAASFVAAPETNPDQGGTVATASILYIALAIAFGLLLRRNKLTLGTGSLIFVPLVFLALVVANYIPFILTEEMAFIRDNPKFSWTAMLLVYCFAASVAPVWVMLQPRDYLSSFLLFACLVFGGIGLVLGSVLGQLPAQYPIYRGFHIENIGFLFPVLFITVACGACSGFHSIVSSGTTSKQLPDEQTARPIAYGGMLTEGALAVVAMATVMWMGARPEQGPTVTFATGIGQFLKVFGLNPVHGAVFGLLAISTFLLTTLDTCTRLTRYIMEEFFNLRGKGYRSLFTMLSLLPLAYFAFKEYPALDDPAKMLPAWQVIWPAFGTTNQLMAALALLVIVVWRRAQGRAYWFVFWPMLFMLVTTSASMVQLTYQFLGAEVPRDRAIGWIIAAMLAMTVFVVIDTAFNWGRLPARGEAVAREEALGEASA